MLSWNKQQNKQKLKRELRNMSAKNNDFICFKAG